MTGANHGDRAVIDRPVHTGSLSRRVIVSVLGVLLIAVVGLGVTVNYVLGTRLHDDLRSRLVDRAYHAQALVDEGVTGQSLADAVAGAGIETSFRTSTGATYNGAPTVQEPKGGRPGPPPPTPAHTTAAPNVTQNGDALTVTLDTSGGELLLQTSQAEVDHTLTELRRIELIAGASILAASVVILLIVVRVALAPLSRMTTLARRIRDGARGRRLRPTRPRTELGRTAAAFDDMLDALESAESQAQGAEARMRQFLADASHDLRTPLSGVIAGAETLLRSDLPREERERRLVALVREARRASRLVEDLLLMARLDAREPTTAPVELDLLAVSARGVEAARLRRPEVTIRLLGDPVTVRGDGDQLARVVGNLLDNAARSARDSARRDVELSVQQFDGAAVLRVRDSGAGVAPEQRERIFDRFVRLDGARTGGGSGLGLPIARAIARAHGGELRCLDRPSPGALFELVLPAIVPAPARGGVIAQPLVSPMVS